MFRHADDLPEGLPFQQIDQFDAFNNANADDFDNLVGIPNSIHFSVFDSAIYTLYLILGRFFCEPGWI